MSSVGYWGRLPWHACRLDGRGSACGRSLRNLMKVWALQIVVGGYLAPGLPVRSCRSDRHLTGYLTIPGLHSLWRFSHHFHRRSLQPTRTVLIRRSHRPVARDARKTASWTSRRPLSLAQPLPGTHARIEPHSSNPAMWNCTSFTALSMTSPSSAQ